MDSRTNGFVSKSIRGQKPCVTNIVCKYWLAGRCRRYPCRFLHSIGQPKQCKRAINVNPRNTWTRRIHKFARNSSNQERADFECKLSLPMNSRSTVLSHVDKSSNDGALRSKYKGDKVDISKFEDPDIANNAPELMVLSFEYEKEKISSSECEREKMLTVIHEEPEVIVEILTEDTESGKNTRNAQTKLCDYWVTGNCVQGANCKDLHSWFSGSGCTLLAKLEGHEKAITGITLPISFDKLLSASKDESVQLWDCHSGQCVHTAELNSDIGCLISKGPWVFVGLQNAVRAWNFKTQSELLLDGPNGLVHALVVDDDFLLAGVQDGSILVWKTNLESNNIELVATLKGHGSSVISLTIGHHRLYSGAKDGTIRVWDVKTLQCLETINGHKNSVTALLCWDNYLLSGSLDNTLKVWSATKSGNLKVIYEVKEEYGIIALSGMKDPQGISVLFSSCKDCIVRLYELPTFVERGRIFSDTEIQTIETGFDGLFFTGDEAGRLFVWKL